MLLLNLSEDLVIMAQLNLSENVVIMVELNVTVRSPFYHGIFEPN
jgi:hypothetical protein